MARLPQPGSDKGTWGSVLNDYLAQVHNSDGTLKTSIVTSSHLANNSVTQSKLSSSSATAGQILSTDGANLTWATPSGSGSVSDATTGAKGVVQLAGDLGGTAAAPTVPGLASKAADGTVVHLSGNETVTGTKNFTGILQAGGQPVVTGDDTRLSDVRTPADGSVSAAKIIDNVITEPKLAISNTPSINQVLSWSGAAMAWSTPAGGAANDGSIEKTVYADQPPAGLTAIAANGTTDDSANIQAHLDYVKATWNAGVVKLPPQTIKCLSGLSIPSGVTLRGSSREFTVLDFSAAGSSIVALTGTHPSGKPVENLKLKGPNGTTKLGYPTNTSTGISFSGIGVTVSDVSIESFFYGVDLTNSNTFFFLGRNMTIGYAGVGIDMNQSASHNGGSSPTENGERMRLVDSVIFNSQMGFEAIGSGVGFFADGCSFDYLGTHGNIGDGFAFLTNCHLETGYAPTDNANWGSINRYMFNMQYTGRLTLNACRLEVRDSGVYSVVTQYTGPASYNSGFARFNDCTWYGFIPTGGARQYNSRDMLNFVSGSNTTLVVYSPFATKWSTIHAYQVSTDASVQTVGYQIYVTSADVSSVAGGTPTQAITLTRVPPAGETSHPQMWVVIEY
jgi:hypothetical protein